MKVVSSRTLELRSALPQIWKERKTLSIMQQCLQANCPPVHHHHHHHPTLLLIKHFLVGYLKCCPFWLQQCMARQFHQSFAQVGYIMHSLTWYSRSLRKLVGNDHSFVGFPCPPRDNRTTAFWGLFMRDVIASLVFFKNFMERFYRGLSFSFLFFFSFVLYLNW